MERDANTPQSQRTTTGPLHTMKQPVCKLKFPKSSDLILIKTYCSHSSFTQMKKDEAFCYYCGPVRLDMLV